MAREDLGEVLDVLGVVKGCTPTLQTAFPLPSRCVGIEGGRVLALSFFQISFLGGSLVSVGLQHPITGSAKVCSSPGGLSDAV